MSDLYNYYDLLFVYLFLNGKTSVDSITLVPPHSIQNWKTVSISCYHVESFVCDLTKHFLHCKGDYCLTIFDFAATTLKFPLLSRILAPKPHLSALSLAHCSYLLTSSSLGQPTPVSLSLSLFLSLPVYTHRFNFWITARFEDN